MDGLVAEGVSVEYYGTSDKHVTALDDVSSVIPDGEFVVMLGPSGCGKTTLLNVLAGFVEPSKGSVTLDGKPIRGPGAERGVVFQNHALFPWLSVLDNVAFPLRLRGVPKVRRDERAVEILRLVGLENAVGRRIWELSGGMQQRVGLARALASDPRVLLMDEPLGALDQITRESMQTLILDIWASSRKSIFMITHGIEEAVFLASQLLVMSAAPGRIIARLDLEFGRRYTSGERARAIKADPVFIEMRERVVSLIFE
jgi:taurine transport system ATP-binding protein